MQNTAIKKKRTSTVSQYMGVDMRKVFESLIGQITSGPNGWGSAMEEIVYNASDADADLILIKYVSTTRKDKVDIHFMDNGYGFSEEALHTALKYLISDKSRDDIDTSGVNGSGLKHLLGLGNFDETEIMIETVHKDQPTVFRTGSITMDYLVGLAHQHLTPDTVMTSGGLPKQSRWNQEIMQRTHGSNIILRNADLSKVYTAKKLINHLAKFLTPRLLDKVRVYDGVSWNKLKPVTFGGEFFTKTYTRKNLGRVTFDLFIDPKYNRGNMHLCGPENRMHQLSAFLNKYDTVPGEFDVFGSCGGHVYIEHGNTWRVHDNTFNEDFYRDGAAKEFREVLLQIAKPIAEKLEATILDETDKEEYRHMELIKQLVEASEAEYGKDDLLSEDGLGKGSKKNTRKPTISSGVSLRPTLFVMKPDQVMEYVITNIGPTKIDLSLLEWDDTNSPIKVTYDPAAGHKVMLSSGEKDDKGFIKITHPDVRTPWKRPAIVSGTSFKYITGPTQVYAGQKALFELHNLKSADGRPIPVKWRLDRPKFGTCSQEGLKTVLSCNEIGMKGKRKLTIQATNPSDGYVFAEKELTYFPFFQEDGAMTIRFGDQSFELKKNQQGINQPLAHMDAVWKQGSGLPVINLNFTAPIFVSAREEHKGLVFLNAIARTAMTYSIEHDVKAKDALVIAEDFLQKMTRKIKIPVKK